MKKLILLVLFVGMILSACAPAVSSAAPPPPAQQAPVTEKYYCTSPESDNGNHWATGTQVCYDTQVYTLRVEILGNLSSNQTVQSESSGMAIDGYASYSSRTWTEGKGILPVKILDMRPAADTTWGQWIDISLPYILKTVDLGAMGIPAGTTVTFICNHDIEALSPVFSGQTFTMERVTHELDDCRLQNKNFSIPQ